MWGLAPLHTQLVEMYLGQPWISQPHILLWPTGKSGQGGKSSQSEVCWDDLGYAFWKNT